MVNRGFRLARGQTQLWSPARGVGALENAHQPSKEGVEGGRIEQEVGHAQKRYQDEHSVNPVPDGWWQSEHRSRIRSDRFASQA